MMRSIGFATCLALLMVACGGGGGGGGEPNGPGQPKITAGSPPAGATGIIYPGYTFTVASGGASPFTWSETGALPPGLALSSAGQLTGTPVTAGTYAITVKVADSSIPALTGILPVSLTIDAIVVITGQTPPAGVHGTPYSFTFTATGGNLPLSWAVTAGTLPPGLTLNPDGTLSGTPMAASSTPSAFTVTVTDSSTPTPATNSVAYAITVSEPLPPSMFMQTGSMTVARVAHSATLLQNGQVLIAGGVDASSSLASAELYDPPSQVFIATGSLTIARSGHTATLLANAALPNYGKVLVAGGGSQTAELYDPTTGTFAATGSMVAPRSGQTATLLPDGRVMIAGGLTASAELFNPSTGKFTATGSMTVSRTGHSATLLPDGRVLVAGGGTTSAELFNPSTGTFTATGSMSKVGPAQTATLLLDGTVLVTGTDDSAELFSPATGTFSLVGGLLTPLTPGFGTTATLRNDGTVLVAGGRIVAFSGHFHADHSIAAAELFATQSEAFTATDSLLAPREGHTATLLADGTVLVAGGVDYSENCHIGGCSPITLVLSSAELFK